MIHCGMGRCANSPNGISPDVAISTSRGSSITSNSSGVDVLA
jgi:hypothetical protein